VEKRERLPTIDTLLRIAEALEIDLSAVLKQAMKKSDW
jgi:transcriptional regulator with XRE-family HTH domain